MDLKRFFNDDRAVSPVIGVILMVAITVILAAVIGTFVLGLGDQVQDTTPRASFGFDTGTYTNNGTDFTSVTITHESGDTISANNLNITVDGKSAYTVTSSGGTDFVDSTFSGDVSAGSSTTIVASASNPNIQADGATDQFDTDGSSNLGIDLNNDVTDGVDVSPVQLSTGDTVRIVYSSPDSDSSSTLGKFEVQ